MKFVNCLLILVVSLMLFACADSSSKGLETKRTYNITLKIYNNKEKVSVTVPITADRDQDLKQDTRNQATANPATDFTLAKAEGGSEAQLLEKGAEALLQGGAKILNNRREETTSGVQEITAPAAPPVTLEPEEPPAVVEEPIGEAVTLKMNNYEDKSYTWLYKFGKASELKGSMTFTFNNNCGSLTVDDISKTYYKEGRDGYVFFNGAYELAQGNKWTHGDAASIFTKKGCVASEVKITHNK